ncbi:MAG: hypothetical protein ABW104_12115 [Candidatus Thiodiazotropha sp. 6PLUC2]
MMDLGQALRLVKISKNILSSQVLCTDFCILDNQRITVFSTTSNSIRRIPFAPSELPIINAANSLGEWLIAQKGLNEIQCSIIRKLQYYLEKQIFAENGESLEFGFNAERDDLNRTWFVCLSDKTLEIFSNYNPVPNYMEQDGGNPFGPVFWHMVEQEDWFLWDNNKLHEKPYNVSRWIEEVSNPEKYHLEGFILIPEVEK